MVSVTIGVLKFLSSLYIITVKSRPGESRESCPKYSASDVFRRLRRKILIKLNIDNNQKKAMFYLSVFLSWGRFLRKPFLWASQQYIFQIYIYMKQSADVVAEIEIFFYIFLSLYLSF